MHWIESAGSRKRSWPPRSTMQGQFRYYNRLPASARPSIIDLFAGVGGISLGAARAGFELKGAVELDERAVAAHRLNFPGATHLQKDISLLSGKTLLESTGLRSGQLHGLVGGPPCQGFSSIGINLADDPRNAMVQHFCRLVGETNPAFFHSRMFQAFSVLEIEQSLTRRSTRFQHTIFCWRQ